MERSLYWYIGSLHILTSTYTTALTAKQVARKVLFPPRLIEHIPLSQIKMTYTIFYVKIATFQKKVTPVFPSNPPLKVEVLSSPPLFENLVGGSTLNLQKGEGGAHYIVMMIENISGMYILIWYHNFQPFCCCKGRVILLQIVYHRPLQTDLTTLDSSHLIRFSCFVELYLE